MSPVSSPVLHLHQVTHQTVARTALYKVLLGRQKALTVDLPEFLDEVFLQRLLAVLLDLVDGHGVIHRLDNATHVGSDQDVVRLYPQWNTLLVPYVLNNAWKVSLKCQTFKSFL